MALVNRRTGSLLFRVGLVACLFGALLVMPAVAQAKLRKNAQLMYFGSRGLEQINAWNKKRITLVPGMTGNLGDAVFGPGGVSVVGLHSRRSDGAGLNRFDIATFPGGTVYTSTQDLGMIFVTGWTDAYTYVWNDLEYDLQTDSRTGITTYYDGRPIILGDQSPRVTAYDKKYRSSYNERSRVLTVRNRKTKKLVSRFKVPGTGGKARLSMGARSFSPDGRWIAYDVWGSPNNDAQFVSYTYIIPIKGGKARRVGVDHAGFTWR
jgi:hypothetical protein